MPNVVAAALSRRQLIWIALLAFAVLARLLLLGSYPLADTTEARYAEVARLMLSSGDWITPQIEAGVPFWGKPPLSFWLTAGSFSFLGISEFAARLPALLQLMATAFLLLGFTRAGSSRQNFGSAAVFLTSALGFISAGAVMTDPTLVFSTTLVMVGFWRAVNDSSRVWGLLFFVGLGLGLIAKGPVAWVLGLTPIGLWALFYRKLGRSLTSLPWLMGVPLCVLISVPWYVLAEANSPGFLEYFLVGEHWLRFVDSGWTGDLYGNAHDEPHGMIWLMWLVSALPWSLFAFYAVFRYWRQSGVRVRVGEERGYLILWAVVPMLFFTLAGNILYTYVLPGLPAFAILIAQTIDTRQSRAIYLAALIPLIFLASGPVFLFEQVNDKSERDLVMLSAESSACENLVYYAMRPYSAEFYSQGKAELAKDHSALRKVLQGSSTSCMAIRNSALATLPEDINSQLVGIQRFNKYTLFRKG